MNKLLLVLSIVAVLVNGFSTVESTASTYKPILLMHGFALSESCGSFTDWDHYIEFIQKYNPGQIAIALDVDNNYDSTKPMYTQINDIYQVIESIVTNNESFANGYHIIAHSQGALSMRAIVEMFGLDVDNFVSLAGVHNGIYGVGFTNEMYFGNFTDDALTDLFYQESMQKKFSVANWWNDPKDLNRFLEKCHFLPTINQDIPVLTPEFKSNFLASIKGSFNAFGSEQDGTVSPWISELFGQYDENMVMIPMNKTTAFLNDSYGLQSLYNLGKLKLTQVDNVKHAEWLSNEDLFTQYVLPLISN